MGLLHVASDECVMVMTSKITLGRLSNRLMNTEMNPEEIALRAAAMQLRATRQVTGSSMGYLTSVR